MADSTVNTGIVIEETTDQAENRYRFGWEMTESERERRRQETVRLLRGEIDE